MNKIITSVLALACSTAISAEALAACTIYQHRDYGGSHWTLGHLDRMKMVDGESLGCTTNGHGSGCESTLYEPSWNDQVSSFRVSGGCTLSLWQHIDEGGARFRSSRSYKYVGGSWNDQASEALCMCQ
jgi:syncollin